MRKINEECGVFGIIDGFPDALSGVCGNGASLFSERKVRERTDNYSDNPHSFLLPFKKAE